MRLVSGDRFHRREGAEGEEINRLAWIFDALMSVAIHPFRYSPSIQLLHYSTPIHSLTTPPTMPIHQPLSPQCSCHHARGPLTLPSPSIYPFPSHHFFHASFMSFFFSAFCIDYFFPLKPDILTQNCLYRISLLIRTVTTHDFPPSFVLIFLPHFNISIPFKGLPFWSHYTSITLYSFFPRLFSSPSRLSQLQVSSPRLLLFTQPFSDPHTLLRCPYLLFKQFCVDRITSLSLSHLTFTYSSVLSFWQRIAHLELWIPLFSSNLWILMAKLQTRAPPLRWRHRSLRNLPEKRIQYPWPSW